MMKNKLYSFCLILGIVWLSGCQKEIVDDRDGVKLNKKSVDFSVIESNSMFYDEMNFAEAIGFAEDYKIEKDIQIIVVPHHLLASRYTADLIKRASGRKIEQVFILGPNHENIGRRPVASVLAKWRVVNGWVESDKELVERFLMDFDLNSSWEVFEKEHSVGAIVPFVNYYLPEAKIVPIVFSTYAGMKDAERASEWLNNNFIESGLVIVSVDFSHYLTKQEADGKDEITKKLILDRDIDGVLRLDNVQHVDSPVSLATALMLAEKMDLGIEIVHHDNAFNLMVEKPVETTSYFGIVFKSKK